MHVDLGTLPGGPYSQATALNDHGLIVGFATQNRSGLFGAPAPRAVVWQNGSIVDIGTLGGPGSYATNVNNDGVIVGSAETNEIRTSELTGLGYYYDYFSYYGVGTGLYGILNSSGTPFSVAFPGFAGGNFGRSAKSRLADPHGFSVAHAFVYADGTMYDMNKLLLTNTGWELTQAHSINAVGQIVGVGIFQGRVHGFFLDPK
jgi:probable HAF family extracellular repeat protein